MPDLEKKREPAQPRKLLTDLTQEQVELAQKWLDEKWKFRTCPICAESSWIMSPSLIAPPLLVKSAITLSGRIYPLVQVICTNCGFVHFFSAGIMELFSEKTGGTDG